MEIKHLLFWLFTVFSIVFVCFSCRRAAGLEITKCSVSSSGNDEDSWSVCPNPSSSTRSEYDEHHGRSYTDTVYAHQDHAEDAKWHLPVGYYVDTQIYKFRITRSAMVRFKITSKWFYGKTPNKRPWAFARWIAPKRAFSPFNSFMRNENQTIFGWDKARNVIKYPFGVCVVAHNLWGGGCLLGVLQYIVGIPKREQLILWVIGLCV